jgi:hypothetical protein
MYPSDLKGRLNINTRIGRSLIKSAASFRLSPDLVDFHAPTKSS